MRILLTNDDGIYAPGLAAMEKVLRRLGEIAVIAPLREQSGVAHAITFLTPMQVRKVFVNDKHWAWAVDGTPADCVKLAISSILPELPDLVVSGINDGHNAGINTYYSGTVGAAVEGSFYGITSVAVSLKHDENPPVHRAAELAVGVIERILEQNTSPGCLYNVNIPLSALKNDAPEVRIVPMAKSHYWESFEHRIDTMGRSYYWFTGRPDPRQPNPWQLSKEAPEQMTDLAALSQGYISVTPLNFDVTDRHRLQEMATWDLTPKDGGTTHDAEHTGPQVRLSWRG